jgi:hypothetical protein
MNDLTIPANSAVSIIQSAIASGIDPASLRELLNVRREWEADEARKSFNRSMTDCQRELPVVVKCQARNSHTNSDYVRYDDLMKVAKPIIRKHGITISFGEKPCDRDGFILVHAVVRHEDGHAEEFYRYAPIDNVGAKGNATKTLLHGCQSSMSYMQRKMIESIFGIAESDEDDDGNAAGTAYVTKEQADELAALVRNTPTGTLEALLEWAACDSLTDIAAAKFSEAKRALIKKQIKP